MQHPDQKYIDALLNNDNRLLEELYAKFSGRIKNLVLYNGGTETDAADIFQDALLAVYHKALTGNFILTCPLEAFLYLICKNKWLTELAKRQNHKVTFTDTDRYDDKGEDSFKQAEDCLTAQARKLLLEEKINELGEGCRQVLRLSWSGKPMDEVASLLNVSYGYVRKKKSECMGRLISLVKKSAQFNSLKW